jgi:hypothetical protein
MSRLSCLFVACGFVAATAVKLSSYKQGAKFDKCISNSDFEGKTLDDDITLIERDAQGCCPAGSVPGAKHYSNYVGAQVICGFKSDGKVDLKTSSSGSVKSCTYNQCYVYKQGLSCKTAGAKQRLNGCCAAANTCATSKCDFATGCLNYAYNFNNAYGEQLEYCLTYNKKYKMEYTSAKTDDQADNELKVDKLYVYTPCKGGTAPATSPGGSTTSSAATVGMAGLGVAAVSALLGR